MRKLSDLSVSGGLFLAAALVMAPALRAQSITTTTMVPEITAAGVMEECETTTDDFETEAEYVLFAQCTFRYPQGEVTPDACGSTEGVTAVAACTDTLGFMPGGTYGTTGEHGVFLNYDPDDCVGSIFPDEVFFDPLGYTDTSWSCFGASCTYAPNPNPEEPGFYCVSAQQVVFANLTETSIGTIDISPLNPTVDAGNSIPFTTNESSVLWALPDGGPGTISAAGVYQAPGSVAAPTAVFVTVTNASNQYDQASTTINLNAVLVTINPAGPVALNQGMSQPFSATVTGTSNSAVTWSLQQPSYGTLSGSGLYQAPTSVTTAVSDVVIATSVADTSETASATVNLQPASITITPVNPNSFPVFPGEQVPLSATVSGFVNQPTLQWAPAAVSMTGPTTAVYTVPASPPVSSPTQITVTATDSATGIKGSTTFTELPGVYVTGVTALAAGQTASITITGSGFGNGNPAVVFSNPVSSLPAPVFQLGSANNTQIIGNITFPVYTTNETVTILVTAGGITSPGFNAGVTPVTVTPSVSPVSATLEETQSQQFTVSFSCKSQNGTACTVSQGATWKISSSPALGTMSGSGLYTNTATGYANSTTVVGQACASVNPAACQSFQIFLVPIAVSVVPGSATLGAGGTQQFSATVSGVTGASGTNDVTWSVSPAVGTVSPAGASISTTYTAPSPVSSAQTVTLKACSAVDSARCNSSAQIQLLPPPTVTPPNSQTVAEGGTATFTVTASGNGNSALSYAWQYSSGGAFVNMSNGGRISGASSATLTITGVQTSDAGSYRCLVADAYGQANSGPATLTVNLPPPPTVTQPGNQTVPPGGTATFGVTAGGQGPFSYIWQFSNNGTSFVSLSDGGNISGSQTAHLTITNVQSANAGRYRCLVSNAGGQSNSGSATLTVAVPPPPTVSAPSPSTETVYAGATSTFSVTASGTGPFSYSWQFSNNGTSFVGLSDGGNISGSQTANLTITDTQTSDAGRYRCLVSNAGGQGNSGSATLTVNIPPPPTVSAPSPSTETVSAGGRATFSVTVSGQGPFSYSWQFSGNGGTFVGLSDGGGISGSQTANLTITNAQSGNAGRYRCLVSNLGGQSNSGAATLTVD